MDVSCEDKCAEECMEGQVSRGKGTKKKPCFAAFICLLLQRETALKCMPFETMGGDGTSCCLTETVQRTDDDASLTR